MYLDSVFEMYLFISTNIYNVCKIGKQIKRIMFWNVTSFSSVEIHRHLGGISRFPLRVKQ
jgi:hypothetical protein